ncbi:MAG: PilZ domain-containing protein [Silvibacterium sp.]|nr:PilZ domain-containing protein [Silvibacterium sp.]
MNNLAGSGGISAAAAMQCGEVVAAELAAPAIQREEKRRYPRYSCEGYAEVLLPAGGMLFRGRIRDLSVSGCFIEAAMPRLERGTLVEVYFVTNQLQFRVQANIAGVREKRGAGISFVNVSPRRAAQIAALIGELAEKH